MSEARPAKVGAVMALAIVLAAGTWPATKLHLQDWPPWLALCIRFSVSGGLLALWLSVRGGPLWPRGRWGLLAIFTIAGFYVPNVLIYSSMRVEGVPSGVPAVLFTTWPLWVAIGEHVHLPHERLGRLGWAGSALGFTGVAVAFWPDLRAAGAGMLDPEWWQGDAGRRLAAMGMAAAAPAVASIATVATRSTRAHVDPLTQLCAPLMICSVLFALTSVALGERFTGTTLGPAMGLAYLTIGGSLVFFFLIFWLMHNARAGTASMLQYGVPFVALFLGWWILGETVSPWVFAGAIVTVAGAALAGWDVRSRHRRRLLDPTAAHA